jgi:hypothetical protein
VKFKRFRTYLDELPGTIPVDADKVAVLDVSLDVMRSTTVDNLGVGPGGGASVAVGSDPPDPLAANTLWVDDTDFTTYLIYDDGDTLAPVQIATPFIGGLDGNLDGGSPSSIFGGTDPIDGGEA